MFVNYIQDKVKNVNIRIVQFFQTNNEDRKFTIKPFEDEGCKKRTIQQVLKHHDDTGKIEYSCNSGPWSFVLAGKQVPKIKRLYLHNPNSNEGSRVCKF